MKSIAFILAIFCAAANAQNAVVEKFISDYQSGVAFAENPSDQNLYARSTDRKMILSNVNATADRITAYYDVTLKYDGAPHRFNGVMMLHLNDGKIVGEEHAEGVTAPVDLALAGQAADVVTTAGALMSGMV